VKQTKDNDKMDKVIVTPGRLY